MNSAFWLGLAFSVPIGITVNLFTPRISKWIGSRNARFEIERQRKQAAREKLSRHLQGNPVAFAVFAQETSNRLSSYLVLIVLAVNIPFYASAVLYGFVSSSVADTTTGFIYLASIVATTVMAVTFLNIRRGSADLTKLISNMLAVDEDGTSSDPGKQPKPSGS